MLYWVVFLLILIKMTCLFSSVVVSSHFCHGPEPTVTLGGVIEKEVAWSKRLIYGCAKAPFRGCIYPFPLVSSDPFFSATDD